MSFRFPVVGRTKQYLDALANPVAANQPEAVAWVFFDTITYTSTTTIIQKFFQTVQTDPSLGNLSSQGQLPDPQYFQIFNVGCDILNSTEAQAGHALTGPVNDIQQLVMSGRGLAVLTIAGKQYFNVPLSFLHTSGGATGFGFATMTAEAQIEWALNSIPDGGFYLGGGVVIPPKQAFDVTLTWPAALTLTASTPIRLWMAGVLHRRVL